MMIVDNAAVAKRPAQECHCLTSRATQWRSKALQKLLDEALCLPPPPTSARLRVVVSSDGDVLVSFGFRCGDAMPVDVIAAVARHFEWLCRTVRRTTRLNARRRTYERRLRRLDGKSAHALLTDHDAFYLAEGLWASGMDAAASPGVNKVWAFDLPFVLPAVTR